MQLCLGCGQRLKEGERVIARVRAFFHSHTDVSHALEVLEELEVDHENCPPPLPTYDTKEDD